MNRLSFTETLTQIELTALADEIASDPRDWEHLVDFGDEARHYVELHRDRFVDVWLLCWTDANDTGWHDHDLSSGAVRIVSGALRESNLRIGGQHRTRVVPAGRTFSFGPDYIHRIAGEQPLSVSIHAYSPPLGRLGQYSFDDDGTMRRQSITYLEELRTLDMRAAV